MNYKVIYKQGLASRCFFWLTSLISFCIIPPFAALLVGGGLLELGMFLFPSGGTPAARTDLLVSIFLLGSGVYMFYRWFSRIGAWLKVAGRGFRFTLMHEGRISRLDNDIRWQSDTDNNEVFFFCSDELCWEIPPEVQKKLKVEDQIRVRYSALTNEVIQLESKV